MNITELKEKLTKWDEDKLEQWSEAHRSAYSFWPDLKQSAKWQHSEDAKTITAFLEIIEEMQYAIKHTNDFCLCTRNTVGFDYHEDHKVQGKPKSGSRWITPRDYNKQTLTATEQKLKNLTEDK